MFVFAVLLSASTSHNSQRIEGKLSRFLSCHGVSLNLIEISPFSPIVLFHPTFYLLHNDLYNVYTMVDNPMKQAYQFSNAIAKLKKRKREKFFGIVDSETTLRIFQLALPLNFHSTRLLCVHPQSMSLFSSFACMREKPFRCKMYHLLSLLDDFNNIEKKEEIPHFRSQFVSTGDMQRCLHIFSRHTRHEEEIKWNNISFDNDNKLNSGEHGTEKKAENRGVNSSTGVCFPLKNSIKNSPCFAIFTFSASWLVTIT